MKHIHTSAPGKVHIIGEHAVVYGKQALLATINKRCHVFIHPRSDSTVTITSKQFSTALSLDKDTLLAFNTEPREPLNHVAAAIVESMRYYNQEIPYGFDLVIDSEIPVGGGMGSSAAVAVSVAGALSLVMTNVFNRHAINDIAYLAEKRQHTNPSGADNGTVCFGGARWYKRETPTQQAIVLKTQLLPQSFLDKLYIFYTGTPEETTAEMVRAVRGFREKNPKLFEEFLQKQESLSVLLEQYFNQNNSVAISKVIRNAQKNLDAIGVVSLFGKRIISAIEKNQGVAKISGAGGKKKNAGVLLVLGEQEKLLPITKIYNLQWEPFVFSQEGVRVD